MDFLFSFAVLALIALVIYAGYVYYTTTGTTAQRLAAGFQGSMTKLTLVVTFILNLVWNGMDMVSQITGDPQFSAVGEGLKALVTPEKAKLIGVVLLALPLIAGWFARNRTAKVTVTAQAS